MSRLSTLSAAALRAMFSPDADDTLVTLLTFSGANMAAPQRIADNYKQRLSATDDEVIHGIVSRSTNFIFLPFEITLPTEDDGAPRCRIVMHDVTRQLMPVIRALDGAPNVKMELVLYSTPDVVEISFDGFLMSGVSYNGDSITAELTVESLALEPFPQHTQTPSYFPGLF